MARRAMRSGAVRGVELPARRFTGWALLYFLLFVCLPILTICLAIDLALYLVFRDLFDSCYAVLCLLE